MTPITRASSGDIPVERLAEGGETAAGRAGSQASIRDAIPSAGAPIRLAAQRRIDERLLDNSMTTEITQPFLADVGTAEIDQRHPARRPRGSRAKTGDWERSDRLLASEAPNL
jgi:hypothetical protein